VPGLKGMKGGFTYNTILEDFSKLNVRWTELKNLVGNNSKISPLSYELVFNGVVDASKLGVPQIRKRLIIIGLRRDLFQYNLEKIDRIKNNIQKRLAGKEDLIGKYPLTPLEVFEGRPLPELCEQYKNTMREYQQIIKEVETSEAVTWYETEWNKLSFDIVKDYLLINNISTPERSGELDVAFEKHAEILKELEYYNKNIKQLDSDDPSNNIPKESLSVSERMKKIPPDKNYSFVKGTEWDVVGKGIGLIYRRIHPLKPAYTVVAYGGGGTSGYHYEKSRGKLTNRERARLQTFPDWFKFKGSFQQVRGQIGEAVPVLLAKRIAEVVVEILEGAE
jgi:DNA (cytosine-5)-methyltransferase 1